MQSRALLLKRLAEIPCLAHAQQCALLNRPSHNNIGDHLIWLAQIHYLEHLRGIAIGYSANPDHYSPAALEQAIGKQPILLSGGGYLGDLWPQQQALVERVVRSHPGNPIVILPQSLAVSDPRWLPSMALTWQSHPDLTVVLRDQASLTLAEQHLPKCRLMLAPDMVFALPTAILNATPASPGRPWLALRRRDRERSHAWLASLEPWSARIDQSDWLSLEQGWLWGDRRLPLSRRLAGVVREIGQRRLLQPQLAQARHVWRRSLPPEWQRAAHASADTRLSLGMLHDGCQQLAKRDLVVSDRLHAILLAHLLRRPSLALDNRTGKVHAYVTTWSCQLPHTRAVQADRLADALRQHTESMVSTQQG